MLLSIAPFFYPFIKNPHIFKHSKPFYLQKDKYQFLDSL